MKGTDTEKQIQPTLHKILSQDISRSKGIHILRKPTTFPFLLVLLTIFTIFSQAHAYQFPSTGTVDVYFSPNGGATNAIVTELNNAKSEILVQAYSFTSVPIAKAMLDARKRDIHIEVVLDKSQKSEKHSSADFFLICQDI